MAKVKLPQNTLQRLQNRYRLTVMNDDTYEEIITFKLSRLSVYIACSVTFVLLITISSALIIYTPLKYYIPGYGSGQSKTELQVLKIRTDSLEQAMRFKEEYLNAVKKTLGGDPAVQRDTVPIKVPLQEVSKE